MSQFYNPFGSANMGQFYTPPWNQMYGPIVNQANSQADLSAANAAPKKKKGGWLWNLFGRPGWMGMGEDAEQPMAGPMATPTASNRGINHAFAPGIQPDNLLKRNDRMGSLRGPIYGNPDLGFTAYTPPGRATRMDQFLGGYGRKTYRR